MINNGREGCATTGSGGQATSAAFSANSTSGAYVISAATAGVSGAASFAETNNSTGTSV